MTEMLWRLHRHDERVLYLVVSRRTPLLDRLMRAVTHFGDAAVTIGIVLLMLVAGGAGWTAAGRVAAFALVGSHLAVQLLKRTINRARPSLPIGLESLIAAPDRFSFPSGHSAASLSIALAAAPVLGAPLGFAVIALAALVGVSRCYLGVHYPGDVIAGWIAAIAAVAVF
jgi:undecaprenyl-diphosphatase